MLLKEEGIANYAIFAFYSIEYIYQICSFSSASVSFFFLLFLFILRAHTFLEFLIVIKKDIKRSYPIDLFIFFSKTFAYGKVFYQR